MTKLQNFIESAAVRSMNVHAFAKEWKSAITASWLLKGFTALISVYAGANYLTNLMCGAIGNYYIAFLAAMLALALLELVNATALFKGFKFMFRRRFVTSVISVTIAIASFSTSFYVSTEGIAAMQADKSDKSEQIDSIAANALNELKAGYTSQIDEQKAAITLIQTNPQGWQGGKRSVLTRSQLAEISNIRAKIAALRKGQALSVENHKAELKAVQSENKANANREGEKYYNVVAILMAVQLFANFALAFFFSRIFYEKEQTKADREDLEHFAKGLFGNMFADIRNRYATMQNYFSKQAAAIFDEAAESSFNAPLAPVSTPPQNSHINPVNAPQNQQNQPENRSRTVGFRNTSQQPENTGATGVNVSEAANYYFSHRPQLCDAIILQAQNQIATTNRQLAEQYGCSEATVRNCRRAIINK